MESKEYRYQLLRFAPNSVSGEFFNIAVVLWDGEGRIVDARFASDYKRMACNPLVDLDYLAALRDEFEEQRLLGEGFSEYLKQLERHLSSSLLLSAASPFLGGDPAEEMDRLVRTYIATPPPLSGSEERSAPAAGSRRGVLGRMQRTFEELGLFRDGKGLRAGFEVEYVEGVKFRFDYGYLPAAGGERYLHALGAPNGENDASRLCLVYDRVTATSNGGRRGLTAVHAEEIPPSALKLLASSRIEPVSVSQAEGLGLRVREELGW